MLSRQKLKPSSKTFFVQHSKKLSTWGLLQFIIITCVVGAVVYFSEISAVEANVLTCIVTSSATLAGVAITGYMGNSAAEKYSTQKFAIQSNITQNVSYDEDDMEG